MPITLSYTFSDGNVGEHWRITKVSFAYGYPCRPTVTLVCYTDASYYALDTTPQEFAIAGSTKTCTYESDAFTPEAVSTASGDLLAMVENDLVSGYDWVDEEPTRFLFYDTATSDWFFSSGTIV